MLATTLACRASLGEQVFSSFDPHRWRMFCALYPLLGLGIEGLGVED